MKSYIQLQLLVDTKKGIKFEISRSLALISIESHIKESWIVSCVFAICLLFFHFPIPLFFSFYNENLLATK